jgi:hypothetical protein
VNKNEGDRPLANRSRENPENRIAIYQHEFAVSEAKAARSQDPRVTELFELLRRRRPGMLAELAPAQAMEQFRG